MFSLLHLLFLPRREVLSVSSHGVTPKYRRCEAGFFLHLLLFQSTRGASIIFFLRLLLFWSAEGAELASHVLNASVRSI